MISSDRAAAEHQADDQADELQAQEDLRRASLRKPACVSLLLSLLASASVLGCSGLASAGEAFSSTLRHRVRASCIAESLRFAPRATRILELVEPLARRAACRPAKQFEQPPGHGGDQAEHGERQQSWSKVDAASASDEHGITP